MNAPENPNHVSNEVLAERISNVGLQLTTMNEKLDKALVEIGRVPVIERDIKTLDEQQERTFKTLREHNEKNAAQDLEISEFKTTAKIVGTLATFLATVALSLSAWVYSQLSALHDADVAQASRIQSLEIRAQIEAQRKTP